MTFDGSEEILNGYASWVYYEEILGRASRYRAFNWSPDSSKIAFLRFDQSRVPQFPLFDAAGPYGRLEMQRYPKPGFPNPAVKIGVIDLAGRQTDWIAFPAEVDHYLTFLAWARGGKSFYLQWLNRGQDELRIYEYTLADQKTAPGLPGRAKNLGGFPGRQTIFTPWPTAASCCSAARAAGTTCTMWTPTAWKR